MEKIILVIFGSIVVAGVAYYVRLCFREFAAGRKEAQDIDDVRQAERLRQEAEKRKARVETFGVVRCSLCGHTAKLTDKLRCAKCGMSDWYKPKGIL